MLFRASWSIRELILISLMAATLGFSIFATTNAQASRPSRIDIENLPHLPTQVDEEEILSQAIQSPNILSWSKVVFQSARDGNWNIYIGNDDGSGHTHLTESDLPEIHPDLNRGNTQIVYARGGDDFEIIKMNVDGSRKIALTANGADDVNPVWSPDGTQIVFESYRDGQAEVYLMNADGSGQRRLTGRAGYDGMPSWSPDGTKIIFVSNRTGGYRIWQMSADGSEPTQLSDKPFSFRPKWSPDGQRIAFDADLDGDGWQELWLMNADGSDERVIHNPRGARDAWMGSWSPDGRFIAFTEINFIQFEGQWYWTEAHLFAHDTTRVVTNFRLNHNATDWNPSWQTSDSKLPTSSVIPLPAYTSSTYAEVAWRGQDVGESGFGGFNIQMREGENGNWQNWIEDTRETNASFSAAPGTTVYFRSRAHDNAYNVEPWPAQADSQTTLYNWAFSGVLVDNRGTPLINKRLTVTPNPLFPTETNHLGAYQGYTLSPNEHVLSIPTEQYGEFDETTVKPFAGFAQIFYLPPKDNLIANSSFEETLETMGGWEVSGDLSTEIVSESVASGKDALVMGSTCAQIVCFSAPTPFILQGIEHMSRYNISIAADKSGTLHLLTSTRDSTNINVYYGFHSPTAGWSEAVLLDQSATDNENVRLKLRVDLEGTLHAAWTSPEGLKYLSKPENGQWSAVKIVSTFFSLDDAEIVDFEVDRDNGLHLLLETVQELYYLERKPNKRWQPAVKVWHKDARTPQLAVGLDKSVHLAWQLTYSNEPEGDHLLFYKVRSPEGVWLEREALFNRSDFFGAQVKGLEVDRLGRVHYLFTDRWLQHAIKTPDGQWSTPIQVYFGASDQLNIRLDEEDRLIAIDNINRAIRYSIYHEDVGWTESQVVLFGSWLSGPFHFDLDPQDNLHLISYFDDSFQYVTTQKAGLMEGSTALTQRVTIPDGMSAPTLTFMARGIRDEQHDESGLTVLIEDSEGATAVFSDALPSQWLQYWVNLDKWRGQEVRIIFQLEQKEADPQMLLYLDDITLGSAYADLWLEAVGDNVAQPGDQLIYQLRYGNRGGVHAQDARILVTLPPELAFDQATPAPESTEPLTWEVGDLAINSGVQTLTLTTTVEASAERFNVVSPRFEISLPAAELETENNLVEPELFIGERLYLPFIN